MIEKQLQTDYPLTQEQIQQYREDGFIKLDGLLTGEDLREFRDTVAAAVESERSTQADPNRKVDPVYAQIFIQRVNLWRRHADVARFALAPRFANLAARLVGGPVRIWHDQALFKEPGNGNRTPWHQDSPYWPHTTRDRTVSMWFALKDANIENGCMSFLPGTQKLGAKEPVNLSNPRGVMDVAPEASGIKAITRELEAGSATFHDGLCFHYAGPNRADATREAFVVIYMPAETRYDGAGHCVTDGQGLIPGEVLDGELFPILSKI